MLKLYSFEMKKLHRTAGIWICLAVFIVFCCATSYISANTFNDAEYMISSNVNIPSEEEQAEIMSEMTEKEKREYKKQIEWELMLRDGASEEQMAKMTEQERIAYDNIRAGKIFTFDVEEAKYEIENNINSSFGIPSFIESALEHTNILMILVAVVISGIVAKEYSNSTIKMSLLSPHRRDEIITAKVLCVLTVIFEFILATAFFCALTGVVFFMIQGKSNPEPFNCMKAALINGERATINASVRLLSIFGMAVEETFMLSAFVVFVAVLSKSVVWTITVPVALYIFPSFVTSDKLKANQIWNPLFFNLQGNYLIIAQNSMHTAQLWTALLATAVWAIIFIAAAIIIFDRQDIYN